MKPVSDERCCHVVDRLAADEAALDNLATRIAPRFDVSTEVNAKRLRAEKLWPPTVS